MDSCACDIAAHNYTYTFEPKYDWSEEFAAVAEIRGYFEYFAAKYDLRRYIKLQHKINRAKWDENLGKWTLQIEHLNPEARNEGESMIEDSCDILINACGYLNNWKWPEIQGLEKFQGTLLHSARWDEHVDLRGKRVGLIGNGSAKHEHFVKTH